MTEPITRDSARDAVRDAIRVVAPDADLDSLLPADNLRETLDLDSMDFLAFVERLSARTGRRIDEDDYAQLSTLDDAVDFLTTRP